jgi:hypothetical protein
MQWRGKETLIETVLNSGLQGCWCGCCCGHELVYREENRTATQVDLKASCKVSAGLKALGVARCPGP